MSGLDHEVQTHLQYRFPVDEFLTKQTLAARLDLPSTRVVDEMVARGVLPAIRLGHRTLRFRWSDVERALSQLTINIKKDGK
jgi:excisionase family DNA binding protein